MIARKKYGLSQTLKLVFYIFFLRTMFKTNKAHSMLETFIFHFSIGEIEVKGNSQVYFMTSSTPVHASQHQHGKQRTCIWIEHCALPICLSSILSVAYRQRISNVRMDCQTIYHI